MGRLLLQKPQRRSFVTIPGRDDKKHRLLTAHVDTLGAMVKEIKADGRLKIDLIGGFRYHSIEGNIARSKLLPAKPIQAPS